MYNNTARHDVFLRRGAEPTRTEDRVGYGRQGTQTGTDATTLMDGTGFFFQRTRTTHIHDRFIQARHCNRYAHRRYARCVAVSVGSEIDSASSNAIDTYNKVCDRRRRDRTGDIP